MELSKNSERQLIQEFLSGREEAFAEIVRRYAPLVFGVSWRILGNTSDAEDATQAVFLTLAHKAGSLNMQQPLAGWLHRVARQVALDARKRSAVRQKHEKEAMSEVANTNQDWAALSMILDEELNALPDKYRLPILLHHVQGFTQEETAAMLCQKVGTVSMHLNRAREVLKNRLAQGGLVLSLGVMVSLISKNAAARELSQTFVLNTSKAAGLIAAGDCALEKVAPSKVTELTRSALRMLDLSRFKVAAAACIAAIFMITSVGAFVAKAGVAEKASQQKQQPAPELRQTKADDPPEKVAKQGAALERASKFLISQQNEDGSFSNSFRTAMTGLSVMALLANGQSLDDVKSRETLRRGIDFVISKQDKDGYFGAADNSKMYGHGICTLMLSQAAQLTNDKEYREKILAALRAAVNLTLKAQHKGGWRYLPTSLDADLSVTTWQIMSLRGAAAAGIEVADKPMKDALAYVTGIAGSTGGFGYTTPDDHASLRGAGIFVLATFDQKDRIEFTATMNQILADGIAWAGPHFYYRSFYTAAGLHQSAKEPWEKIQPALFELIISHQNGDGSFSAPPDDGEADIGERVYVTSLATIILSMDNTALPLFQTK